jgi:hypothetical protein
MAEDVHFTQTPLNALKLRLFRFAHKKTRETLI